MEHVPERSDHEEEEAAQLRRDLEEARRRAEEAERLVAELDRQAKRLEREKARLASEVEDLRKQLFEAQAAQKRQAAPFSKGAPKNQPKRPGRKSGKAYGKRSRRPTPAVVDERHQAPLPGCCPDPNCAGRVVHERTEHQYQTEIPEPKPIVREFEIHIGRCEGCGSRIQGRHELQTSDALGAAACQLGANAVATAAYLNKEMGLSYEKVCDLYGDLLGIEITRGGLVQAMHRAAAKLGPAHMELIDDLQANPVVYADETGARINGRSAWNWVFRGEDTTVYKQCESRGFDVIEEVLGADFSGFVGHDGWHAYDKLEDAIHQQCLGHFKVRARRLMDNLPGRAQVFPRDVLTLFEDAIALGKRYRAEKVSRHGLAVATGRLEKRLDTLLARNPTNGENARLRKHMAKHQEELFTFLHYPDFKIEPVNWPGEQGIRWAVIFRKNSAGHRSPRGSETQDRLKSFFRTAKQRAVDGVERLAAVLRSPVPVLRPIDPT